MTFLEHYSFFLSFFLYVLRMPRAKQNEWIFHEPNDWLWAFDCSIYWTPLPLSLPATDTTAAAAVAIVAAVVGADVVFPKHQRTN